MQSLLEMSDDSVQCLDALPPLKKVCTEPSPVLVLLEDLASRDSVMSDHGAVGDRSTDISKPTPESLLVESTLSITGERFEVLTMALGEMDIKTMSSDKCGKLLSAVMALAERQEAPEAFRSACWRTAGDCVRQRLVSNIRI